MFFSWDASNRSPNHPRVWVRIEQWFRLNRNRIPGHQMPDSQRIFQLALLLLLALASAMLTPAAESAGQKYLVYVGTYTDHGSKGIYAYRFDSLTGKLTSLGL